MPSSPKQDETAFRGLLRRTLVLPLLLLSLLSVAFTVQVLVLRDLQRWVDHSDRVIAQTNLIQKLFLDSESGLRGFLLTRREDFLEPYNQSQAALGGELGTLRYQVSDNPEQAARLKALEPEWNTWVRLSRDRIEHQRAGQAPTLEDAEHGRARMDSLRAMVHEILAAEETVRGVRLQRSSNAIVFSLLAGVLLALAIGAVIAVGGRRQLLALSARYEEAFDTQRRQTDILRHREWVNRGQAELADELRGNLAEDVVATRLLAFVARYLDAKVGVLYATAEQGDTLERLATFACPAEGDGPPASLRPGESWIGQVARDGRVATLSDVPEDHVKVASGTGASAPRHLLLAPAAAGGTIVAVLELGFLEPPAAGAVEYLETIAEAAGSSIRAARYRSHLQRLLSETQRQSEELQVRQEELRVSNEELEEQSQALQRAHAQTEAQQEELEATNAQLEEQTHTLEEQRDRLEEVQRDLIEKAEQLGRAYQYKSEFLANMSHELRTPLNSSLILAKLLADNRDGNLTPEQVKYAHSIHASGNDLLLLINDILDLSRIEAGRVEITFEPVSLPGVLETLVRTFQPLAEQKRLRLTVSTAPGTPPTLETDAQRFQQILTNLLSNAIKFTAEGEVSLRAFSSGTGVGFAVRDTGIGIPPDKQGIIFEAFRQADGGTHRQYGGTGLGLTISRDLARRLGGDLLIESAPDQGSTFTLLLPVSRAAAPLPPVARVAPPARPVAAPPASRPDVHDDRAAIGPGARVILIVEDDLRFAEVLAQLAHEQGFLCLMAPTGAEGLDLARRHRPKAIILDMNLPDESGLSVLERLKRGSDTRHIPVHVVSVDDYSQRALELGAIGYALKPVRREDLAEVFDKLRRKSEQQTGRVLIVDGAADQRDTLRQLLESDTVEITAVGTAAAALDALRTSTFDCMVLDLGLPDVSGYDLLEKISQDRSYSFPPVVVYTGRTPTAEEEMRLRRYSRSVVIKGARSPDRLLDEVTLFLHRVESDLPREQQRMLREARNREALFEGRRILLAEDDVRNIFALSSLLEPKGAHVEIARNGREALAALERAAENGSNRIDVVLMDIMMPEMDGLTAMRAIRQRPEWSKLPIIALTAKAMADDRAKCLDAGANDYIAKPLDVEKLLSLLRVWMVTK